MTLKANKDHRKTLGTKGEKIAEEFLKNKGFQIIEKNYKNKYGEIDIIAKQEEELIFVEVRTKSSAQFSDPETWVDFKKQNKLIRMANLYISEKDITNTNCRFDVIGITLTKNNNKNITHIENAFFVT